MVLDTPYEQDDNLHVVKFDTTPIMSTYLVAFVVGEFDYVEETSTDGVLVRVYTPLGKKEQGRFGLYVAAKVLPYYKEYFGVEYPLPKMDLVAVADFAAGTFALPHEERISYLFFSCISSPDLFTAGFRSRMFHSQVLWRTGD